MNVPTMEQSPELILKRIDDIITELQVLRQQVLALETRSESTSRDIVDALAGSLGQGTWDEYDKFLDWERFAE
jgi:low affinity Fe/Cu permease